MAVLHIDYETRSRVDLFKEGAHKYAADPSTEIICLGWAFDDDAPEIWVPGENFPKAVANHLLDGAPASTHAHNAQFERLITKHVLARSAGVYEMLFIDRVPIDAWYCTAAQARARALPGGLDDLGRCLGLSIQKDKRGKELIKLLSIPDVYGEFNYDPDLLQEMYDYCRTDVVVERAAAQVTPPLTEAEHRDWVISEMVNDAGLKVDLELAAAAAAYADAEVAEISAELARVTGGKITSPKQYDRIKQYMAPLMGANEAIRKAMTVVRTDRRSGEETRKVSLDRDARAKLRQIEEDEPGTLPDDVAAMVELVDDAGRASTAKYKNMVNRAGSDGRVRGAYIYAGAGQTGRFSSVGLQVHNMPRRAAKNPEAMREAIIAGGALENVMDDLSSMLRPALIADDGHSFVCGDWSAIEARVLPWLSASSGGTRVLEIFQAQDRDPLKPDVYMDAAASLYGVPAESVDPVQRQIGKVVVLSAGYQGGYRAFQAMARAYGVSRTDDEAATIIQTWRQSNEWAVTFWSDLDAAARDAVRYVGEAFRAGRVVYCKPRETGPLYCELPSGRILSYPDARLDTEEGNYGPETVLTAVKAQWKPRQGETAWGRINLYGGLLAENITQATAADILRHAMALCVEDGWPVVGTTHDELLLEVRDGEVAEALEGLEAIMLDLPEWAPGLPMKAELWSGRRYRK